MKKGLIIGVLGLQGAVSEHIEALERAMRKVKVRGKVISVRKKEDLAEISGLVIPGGESTTINRLMLETKIFEKIIELSKNRSPILASCAGAILLAKEGDEQVKKTETQLLGLMEMKILRNAYGRQVDSFEANVRIPEIGKKPFRAVFIRAPLIEKVWGETKIWAEYQNKPRMTTSTAPSSGGGGKIVPTKSGQVEVALRGEIVGAKKGNILALTFHPELTSDSRIHEYFLKLT